MEIEQVLMAVIICVLACVIAAIIIQSLFLVKMLALVFIFLSWGVLLI